MGRMQTLAYAWLNLENSSLEDGRAARRRRAPSPAILRRHPLPQGEQANHQRMRVHFWVLHSGATMQPFSFSWLSLSSSIVPE